MDASQKAEQAMTALYNFLAADKPIPDDMQVHLMEGAWDYLTQELTLDEAFGLAEVPSQRRGRNEKRMIKWKIYEAVMEYMDDGKTVPWHELAQRFNMSQRKFEDLWAEARDTAKTDL